VETEMEFFVAWTLDPALVLVRVVFCRNYMGLDGIMLGDKGTNRQLEEIFDLLLGDIKRTENTFGNSRFK